MSSDSPINYSLESPRFGRLAKRLSIESCVCPSQRLSLVDRCRTLAAGPMRFFMPTIEPPSQELGSIEKPV